MTGTCTQCNRMKYPLVNGVCQDCRYGSPSTSTAMSDTTNPFIEYSSPIADTLSEAIISTFDSPSPSSDFGGFGGGDSGGGGASSDWS